MSKCVNISHIIFNTRKSKFNTCTWGIHIGMMVPQKKKDSEATLGIQDIFWIQEKRRRKKEGERLYFRN